MGLIYTQHHLLGHLGLSGQITCSSWTDSYYKTVLLEGITCLQLPTHLHYPPHPNTYPFIHVIPDITVVKSCSSVS